MRRLLILMSNFPENKNDSGNWILRFVENLNERFDIRVLVPHSSNSNFIERFDKFKVYRFPYFYPFEFQRLAYGTGGIPYNFKSSYLARIEVPFFILSQIFISFIIILLYDIEIINSHWLVPQGFVGAICRFILHKPHVAILHSSEMTFLKNFPFGRNVVEFVAKNSDAIVSVSNHRAEELLDFVSPKLRHIVKEKIKIIPMGVDIEEYNNYIEKDNLKLKYGLSSKYIVLFAGRLVEGKGCQYLIHAFKYIMSYMNDIELVILGSGPLDSKLKNLVDELNLKNYINFKGEVDYGEMGDYYLLSDIVVIPSIVDSSGFQEGLPVVLLEALAAGKPVIATAIKAFLEIINDKSNGLLVEPKNPKQLADSILMLLSNQELQAKLSENALKTGKRYSWDVIKLQYINIFNDACK